MALCGTLGFWRTKVPNHATYCRTGRTREGPSSTLAVQTRAVPRRLRLVVASVYPAHLVVPVGLRQGIGEGFVQSLRCLPKRTSRIRSGRRHPVHNSHDVGGKPDAHVHAGELGDAGGQVAGVAVDPGVLQRGSQWPIVASSSCPASSVLWPSRERSGSSR